MNAMLDPRIVAASVRCLRRCDSPVGKVGVERMTPAWHGGLVAPSMRSPPTRLMRRPRDKKRVEQSGTEYEYDEKALINPRGDGWLSRSRFA
ncbi:hypothetical protein QA640_47070 (plasmid) [Bradyrhizobium sp. CB82]|uniref:hypothetical protein n=1 Tax=Bradyrhizobium sp. CB82 TaxID=3039159 RepID=UPI0024B21D0C|nr:hypothetical protein [Bradyrhizobium sp. CB82]WFU45567.1 hypothetical protein QA640_47070 [Bradyrhizobium sp. CB82]